MGKRLLRTAGILTLWVMPAAAAQLEHAHVEAEALDLVEISFVARDRAGSPIRGLGKDDFRLRVDRIETALESVAGTTQASRAPLSIVFLTDVSTSMEKIDRKRFLAGSQAMLARLRPVDEMMIATFGEEPEVHCDFTQDAAVLSKALEAIPEPDGGTNLWRALELAVDRLSARRGRGVIVLYSDGGAAAGSDALTAESDSPDVLDRTNRRAIALYWIVPHFQSGAAVRRNGGLRSLATSSGGRWILESAGIESALDEVGVDLAARYDASFYVDKAQHARGTYAIDLRARRAGVTVRAPLLVTGSGSLLKQLERMLRSERPADRMAAAMQLRGYGTAEASPPLLRAYRREADPAVRDALLGALRALR